MLRVYYFHYVGLDDDPTRRRPDDPTTLRWYRTSQYSTDYTWGRTDRSQVILFVYLYSVFGTRYLVLGIWYSVFGTRYSIPGTLVMGFGTDANFSYKNDCKKFLSKIIDGRYSVLGIRYLVFGTRYLVFGIWYSVFGTRYVFTHNLAQKCVECCKVRYRRVGLVAVGSGVVSGRVRHNENSTHATLFCLFICWACAILWKRRKIAHAQQINKQNNVACVLFSLCRTRPNDPTQRAEPSRADDDDDPTTVLYIATFHAFLSEVMGEYIPSTEYRVLTTEYRIPSTDYRVPNTEYRIPSTPNK